MKTLGQIAYEAYYGAISLKDGKTPLDWVGENFQHEWQSSAQAVREAVLLEAIERAGKIGKEFAEKSERAEIEDDAHYYDAVAVGAKRVEAALVEMLGVSGGRMEQADSQCSETSSLPTPQSSNGE